MLNLLKQIIVDLLDYNYNYLFIKSQETNIYVLLILRLLLYPGGKPLVCERGETWEHQWQLSSFDSNSSTIVILQNIFIFESFVTIAAKKKFVGRNWATNFVWKWILYRWCKNLLLIMLMRTRSLLVHWLLKSQLTACSASRVVTNSDSQYIFCIISSIIFSLFSCGFSWIRMKNSSVSRNLLRFLMHLLQLENEDVVMFVLHLIK